MRRVALIPIRRDHSESTANSNFGTLSPMPQFDTVVCGMPIWGSAFDYYPLVVQARLNALERLTKEKWRREKLRRQIEKEAPKYSGYGATPEWVVSGIWDQYIQWGKAENKATSLIITEAACDFSADCETGKNLGVRRRFRPVCAPMQQ